MGKYFMPNGGAIVGGVFEHEVNGYTGTHVSRVIHDFYELDPELGLQGGGGIDTRWHLSHRVRHLGHVTRGLQWGREWKRQLRQGFNRSRYALSHTTRLPLEGNRITLDPELNHAWRLPALQLTYALGPRDLALYQFFEDRANDLLVAAARKAWRLFPLDAPPLPANHLLGTCRMGNEPGKSVTDKFHRAHDVPDLLLVSGTSFVTSGRG